MENKFTPRDGSAISLWQAYNIQSRANATVSEKESCDVLIIGAGITGVTTALMLQSRGKKCVLVEANHVGFGTTGGTSAHLNTFFDATYPGVEKDFGKESAKLLAQAGKDTFSIIKDFINSLAIDCDYAEKPGILYAEDEAQAQQLQQIKESSIEAGVEVCDTSDNKIPVDFTAALKFVAQGQFHPLRYLEGLVKEFLRLGGVLYENSRVVKIESDDDIHLVHIQDRSLIKARNVVYATHVPPGFNLFNFRCAAYRSYVIAVKLKEENYPEELIYDMQEPYHYIRTHNVDGQSLLLIGGEDHKTGQGNEEESLRRLTDYASAYFDISEVVHGWSSQYYVPVDGLPYIGAYPGHKNTYLATGFNGNGMIFGTLAGQVISDQILRKENPYSQLFDPSRIKPIAGFKEWVKENADVAVHFVKDRLNVEGLESLQQIPADSGQVVELDGEKLAVYKSKDGKIHALSPVCSHAGCIVKWNPLEKSWDCPCHGGRYDPLGNVLTGPPRKPLEEVSPPSK
ncbi:MAG TPA: FAD-dependent oxidoreductase [Pelobium sp.]|nr:FAD-dependent oxidoreductase [Pelobium sp.]